ncbi:MAG: DevR family CRISPR-associated autoregulator [Chloroflexi bacterium]|nr:DevR family CRISPR-associated autoregulator [Chloroflexota bacterium]
MTNKVYSLSISARVTLDMHSLNNEGSEGTQIQTRMVDIVAANGRLYNVNAISGDMFKHIQAEHLYHIAKGNDHLPLCAACQLFDANRISADDDYMAKIQGQSDAKALDLMLERCVLDDLEGNLITGEGRSTPRKSVVEFGWVVGIPVDEAGNALTTTSSYFHVKYATERGAEAREAAATEEARRANLGQVPFHRPASSGIYAVVSHYETSRIGFNDITRRYVLDDAARRARYKALLESMLYTFVQPKGAMRATQLPHIVAFEGVVSYSTDVVPAPTVSPLNGGYQEEIKGVAAALNGLRPGAVTVCPFGSIAEFAEVMRELVKATEPFTVAV